MTVQIKIPAQSHDVISIEMAYDRPQLTGSGKQVSWANDIRASYEAEIVKMLADNLTRELNRSDNGHRAVDGRLPYCLTPSDRGTEAGDKIFASLQAYLDRFNSDPAAQAVEKFFGNNSAKFWIDNRNRSVQSLLSACR